MFLTKISLITELGTDDSPLNITHIRPAWRNAPLSLVYPVSIRFCCSLVLRLLSPNKFGINRSRQNVHSGVYVIVHPRLFPVATDLHPLYLSIPQVSFLDCPMDIRILASLSGPTLAPLRKEY